MKQQILVAGATGRTGRLIVKKLLLGGIQPRGLARDLTQAKELFGEALVLVEGDVRNPGSLMPAIKGCGVVISAIGSRTPVGANCPRRVDFEGVANLVDLAKMADVTRFILISSIAVTQPAHPLNHFGGVLDWKRQGEVRLQNSGLDFTIIRPGGLKDTPGGMHELIFDQGDRISGTLSRADLAEACLQALHHPASSRQTFELIEGERRKVPNWVSLFSQLV